MKLALLFLTLGAYSGAALAFLTQVLLARSLSVENFGLFSAALSFITLVTPIAGFGVGMFWLKAFGEEGWQGIRWIQPSVRFSILSTIFVLVAIFLWAFYAPHDSSTRNVLIVLSLMVIGQAAIELSSSIYQLEERFLNLAVWQLLPHAMRFTALFVLWLLYPNKIELSAAAAVYAVTAVLMIIVGSKLIFKVYSGKIELIGHGIKEENTKNLSEIRITHVFSSCWPFGLAGVFYFIYFQGSIVIVNYLLGSKYAAQYSIAITVITAIYIFPGLIYQKLLLPKIHRLIKHDKKKLESIYYRGNFIMLLVGGVAAVLVVNISPYFMPLIFGDSYMQSVELIAILALAIPLRFLATSIGSMLATGNYMRKKVFYMGATAAFSLLVCFAVIPYYGILGAAYAAVLVELFQVLIYFFAAQKIFKKSEG